MGSDFAPIHNLNLELNLQHALSLDKTATALQVEQMVGFLDGLADG